MAEQKYYTIVTDLGTELMAKAAQKGQKVNVVSIAAGDGDGVFYKPTSDMTALKREIWRGEIQNYEIDSVSRNVMKISGVIPKEVGHFVLREMALFDDNNNMIAVCNAPDLLKAVLEEGALTEAVVYMRIAVTNTEAVNIVVNSSAIYATVQDLDAHKNDENAHKKLFDEKVDKTEFIAELDKKVNETKFTTELNKKVDNTEFTTELNKKVDNTEFTTELSKKVDKTDFTGENIGSLLEATGWQSGSDMTASEILEALKTVDGKGSGLDAELLNGKDERSHHAYAGNNMVIGSFAFDEWMKSNNGANNNMAIGRFALYNMLSGEDNIAIGNNAVQSNTNGNRNIGIGFQAMYFNKTGNSNVAIGHQAAGSGGVDTSFSNCTAIGANALFDIQYNNCTGLGYNAQVTASNQVQLGDNNVTVYAQTAVQTRSDARDKIEIQDTVLGLDFIKKLTPRQFKMNSRELYFEQGKQRDFNAKNDGSKAGKRFHQGFVAQEVKQVIDEMGVDFAGYQDHKINGGQDVLSLGYTEFIAPIVKAIQQQQQMIELQQQEIEALKQKINGEVFLCQQENILQ